MRSVRHLLIGSLGAMVAISGLAAVAAAPAQAADPIDIQIIGTNDFHGRIKADGANAAGAGELAGAVKQLRTVNPNTIFAAAGDLIGASTFESFIQKDEPTIDALNSAGLEVSAAGNHEFDKGYEDLVGRVQDRANWEYIAANVTEPAGRDDLAETWKTDVGGVTVGFVGAVTEELPSLVSPAGMAGVGVIDIVDATNDAAQELTDAGADIVVLLIHEGAPGTNCDANYFTDPATVWGNIVQNTSANVDAIISGHTHLAYNCKIKNRPVVSAGQYGTNLDKLVFSVDPGTHAIQGFTSDTLALVDPADPDDPSTVYPVDGPTQTIVDNAVAQAKPLGAVPLGELAGPFSRAKFAGGKDNRGGESTLGNLVAEVQREMTGANVGGPSDLAMMNPGGLRADMAGTVVDQAWLDDPINATWADDYAIGDRVLTYQQAATVQPFANTLVKLNLTGAQIEEVLEQQWQRNASNAVPTRAFLKLGLSKGFTYTYTQAQDPVQVAGVMKGDVTGMWLDGEAIVPASTYSVTVNSFLAAGGDNFRELANATNKQETGATDLEAMVDYLALHAADAPLPIDSSQRAVNVTGLAASYGQGAPIVLDLASLSMTGPGDAVDASLTVKVDGVATGAPVPVTTTPSDSPDGEANSNDEAGTAHLELTAPMVVGAHSITLTGVTTGTAVTIPITVTAAATKGQAVVSAKVKPKKVKVNQTRVKVKVTVFGADGKPVTGQVKIKVKGQKAQVVTVVNGKAKIKLKAFTSTGTKRIKITYLGTDGVSSMKIVEKVKVVRR